MSPKWLTSKSPKKNLVGSQPAGFLSGGDAP